MHRKTKTPSQSCIPQVPKLYIPQVPKLYIPQVPKLYKPQVPKLYIPQVPKFKQLDPSGFPGLQSMHSIRGTALQILQSECHRSLLTRRWQQITRDQLCMRTQKLKSSLYALNCSQMTLSKGNPSDHPIKITTNNLQYSTLVQLHELKKYYSTSFFSLQMLIIQHKPICSNFCVLKDMYTQHLEPKCLSNL